MKYILFTDLHVDFNIHNEVWGTMPIKAVDHLATTARRRNISKIIFLGDFYNNRKEISVKGIDVARKVCEILNEFETYIICGNHDSYFKNTLELTSLQTIDKFKNISIITKPTTINDRIGLCPWSGNYKELKTPILMGHFDIKDFKMNDNATSVKGEEISSFKNFELVLSGHYHTYSKKNNIIFIGNMYGLNFNDIDSTRGYWIFDDETLEMEFVEFDLAPRFIKVFDMELDEKKIEGNIIKVYFTKEYSEKDILDFLTKVKSLNPMEIDVDYSMIKIDDVKMEVDESQFSTLDEKQLFFNYIDKISVPDHLKVSMCKKILDDLFTDSI